MFKEDRKKLEEKVASAEAAMVKMQEEYGPAAASIAEMKKELARTIKRGKVQKDEATKREAELQVPPHPPRTHFSTLWLRQGKQRDHGLHQVLHMYGVVVWRCRSWPRHAHTVPRRLPTKRLPSVVPGVQRSCDPNL